MHATAFRKKVSAFISKISSSSHTFVLCGPVFNSPSHPGGRTPRAPSSSSAYHAMYRTVLLALLAGSITSLRVPNVIARRRAIALAVGAVAASQSNALPALAADSKPVKVYFGAGCFWHVQHEFTMEEMSTLKRSSSQISAVSGYAGGQRLGDGGKVCCELKAARIHGRFARPRRRPHSADCRVNTLTA